MGRLPAERVKIGRVVIIEIPPRMLFSMKWHMSTSVYEFQRDMSHSKCCIPSETGSGVVMYSIETYSVLSRLHGTSRKSLPRVAHPTSSRCRGSQPLIHIQRQSTLELSMHTPCRVQTRTVRQFAEECILRRQSRFIKSVETIHIVIGIDSFLFDEFKLVSGKGFPHVLEHHH